MKVYTASVIGAGMGGRLSINALVESPRFRLLAVADLRADVRKQLYQMNPYIKLYPSHTELFTDCPTDVVCVSTFPPSHREVTLDALELNLAGILVEKPLGDTAAAGRDILHAIKARGLPVAVPHGLLKLKHSEEIIARVRSGDIGDLELVEIECNKWDIMNAGIHWLNFFVNLLPDDPAAWVMSLSESSTRTYRDGMQVETTAITYLQTVHGVRCVMHTGDEVLVCRPGKDFIFRLLGTRGSIEFYAFEGVYKLTNPQHPLGQEFRPEPYPISPHQRHLEAMADQIESGVPDYSIAESSLAALELVEAAYISSAHRCKVTLPLSHFTIPPEPDWAPGRPYSGEGGGRDGRKL